MTAAVDKQELRSLPQFKTYPTYKDSGVEWLGKIPTHWDVKRLKNCVSRLASGGTPESDNFDYWTDDESGTPWVAISDMTRSYRVSRTAKRLTDRGLQSKRLPVLPAGTLLYSMYASLGKVALLEVDAVVNQAILGLVPRADLASRDFLRWWLDFMQGHVLMLSSSNTQDNLNADKVRTMPVILPPAQEQPRITAFLERETTKIDALIAKKERLIELLQEKRTALIARAVTQSLDPKVRLVATGSTVFPEIPEHWKLRKLRRLIGRVQRPVAVEGETEYREIGIRSWGKGIFHKDPLRGALLEDKSVFYVEPEDLVLNIVFAWEGAVAVVSEHELGMVASHRFPTFRHSEDVDLDYLLMVLQSEQGRALMGINSPGAAGRNRTIRLHQFLDEEMPVPPLAEQHEIVGAFRAEEKRLESLLPKVRDAIEHLKELRMTFISAAVTGKIDVREVTAS